MNYQSRQLYWSSQCGLSTQRQRTIGRFSTARSAVIFHFLRQLLALELHPLPARSLSRFNLGCLREAFRISTRTEQSGIRMKKPWLETTFPLCRKSELLEVPLSPEILEHAVIEDLRGNRMSFSTYFSELVRTSGYSASRASVNKSYTLARIERMKTKSKHVEYLRSFVEVP